MNKRPTCECGNITAINYHKNGKTYYRKKCYKCSKESTVPKKPDWQIVGYVKQISCERCGFRSKYADQIKVIKTENNAFKSVCLNCSFAVQKEGWHKSELTPDF